MPERSFILDIPLPCQVDAELPLTQVIVLTRPSDSYVGFLFLLPLLYPLPSFVYPDSVLPLPLAPVSCPSFPGDVSSPSGISDVFRPTNSLILTTNIHDRSCDMGILQRIFFWRREDWKVPPNTIYIYPLQTGAFSCLLPSNLSSNSVCRCSCLYSWV